MYRKQIRGYKEYKPDAEKSSKPINELYSHTELSRMKTTFKTQKYDKRHKNQYVGCYSEENNDSDSNSDDLEMRDIQKNDQTQMKECNIPDCHIANTIQSQTDIFIISNKQKTGQKVSLKNDNWIIIISAGLLTIFIIFMYLSSTKGDNFEQNAIFHKERDDDITLSELETSIKSARNIFAQQKNDIWLHIKTGIIQVFKGPEKISIFLLFGNMTETTECLALTIGDMSRHALGTKSALMVKPEALDENTGNVIKKLEPIVEKSKSVVILDLLLVNVKALMAFHNLCDRYNPLVKKAIYIITIKADGYSESESSTGYVEKLLKRKLNGKVDDDQILPLVTRITDAAIFFVKPELIRKCPVSKDSFTNL